MGSGGRWWVWVGVGGCGWVWVGVGRGGWGGAGQKLVRGGSEVGQGRVREVANGAGERWLMGRVRAPQRRAAGNSRARV